MSLDFDPCIVILCGLPFAGKTTLAQELSRISNFVHLDSDIYRLSIVGSSQPLPEPQEARVMLQSYQMMHTESYQWIKAGNPVVLAATYWRPAYKPLLVDFLQGITVPYRVFELQVDDVEVRKRVEERDWQDNPSEIKTFEQYLEIKRKFDPITLVDKIYINTATSLTNTVVEVLSHLRDLQRDRQ